MIIKLLNNKSSGENILKKVEIILDDDAEVILFNKIILNIKKKKNKFFIKNIENISKSPIFSHYNIIY